MTGSERAPGQPLAQRMAVAGAGLLGRLAAWHLQAMGHEVHVFDPAPSAGPCFADQHRGNIGIDARSASLLTPDAPAWPQAAGFTAAGMLSPIAELDNAEPALAAMGWRSIVLWRAIVAALGRTPGSFAPFFAQRGSWMLAHRSDLGSAQRVLARLQAAQADGAWQAALALARARFAQDPAAQLPGALPQETEQGVPNALNPAQLQELEPGLAGAAHAWFLPAEGQLDTANTLVALHLAARGARVHWHWNTRVEGLDASGQVRVNGPEGVQQLQFDQVLDTRGLGARPDWPVRGVRGEVVWLHAPGHGLTRPVRLLHPRHRVYIVPRPGDLLLVGASEIESEDRSPMSLRTAVELMAAAHSVLPAVAEARIVRMDVNLRPALPDNGPRIAKDGRLLRINGLFRHGWLLAPALLQQALHVAGLPDTLAGVSLAEVGGLAHAPWITDETATAGQAAA